MFTWPGTPTARAEIHEIADFAELKAWRDGITSTTAISQDLGRLDDQIPNNITDEEETDEISDHDETVDQEDGIQLTEEICSEILLRQEACRENYPFLLTGQGYTLQVCPDFPSSKYSIYKYLLLATRLDMNTNRSHSDINGTLLLEELAAAVAREYLGERADSLVFGTASGTSGFENKVDLLCQRIGEGGGFRNPDIARSRKQDANLDVVAWKDFTDRRPGKIILFGQCKTGTHYKDTLAQLQPDTFCKNWMRSTPAVTPVRMFFISEDLPADHWDSTVRESGILFDRSRIIDFFREIDEDLLNRIEIWTDTAARKNDLPSL